MEKTTIALIDGDVAAYKAAFVTEDKSPVAAYALIKRIIANIEKPY